MLGGGYIYRLVALKLFLNYCIFLVSNLCIFFFLQSKDVDTYVWKSEKVPLIVVLDFSFLILFLFL